MKIALAQMDVVANKPKQNLETMLKMINEAKDNHVDLIAFPEMCVGGYLLGDKWLDDNYCRNLMSFNEDIKNASDGIAVAFGNVYLDDKINERVGDNFVNEVISGFHPNKDGRTRKYNAVYVVQNGEYVEKKIETNILPKGVLAKTLLPNYRIFDDERYFFSMQDITKDFDLKLDDLVQPFLIEVDGRKVPIGFEICEDLWCNDYRKNGNAINPTKYLVENGAQQIVNLSASPWTFGKNGARDRRIEFLKKELDDLFVPFFYVNNVGAQNNGKNIVTFDGGSTIYNGNGNPVIFAKEAYREEMLYFDTEQKIDAKTRIEDPKIAQKYKAIVRGIQHVKDITGAVAQPKYVIGLSGGIDSSVVAALVERAVGNDKLLGINMPTKFNSAKTKDAAKQLAKNLDIPYITVPIEEIVEANAGTLAQFVTRDYVDNIPDLALENIQAKIRGTSVLSNVAGIYSAIFTNNGNKLETALGYATLYGDVGGAIAPIADLTKAEVFDLAKYLNREIYGREVVPEKMIPDNLYRFQKDQIAPSAELKNAQIDPMKFGYHDALLDRFTDYKKSSAEDVLRWYIDGTLEQNLGISTDLIYRWGIEDPKTFVDDLEWFDRKVQQNVFKRVQAPPIIITSKSAYGYDIRESQLPYETTREYDLLRDKVLVMKKYGC
jgi:NAD+ synthase (glutamine-hydrolysing)